MYLQELNKIINETFIKNGYNIETKVIQSDRPDLCDYQCNDIFKVAKEYHKNPIQVGEEIVNSLNATDNIKEYFSNIEFVKPGFINLKLSDTFINKYTYLTYKDIKSNISLPTPESFVIDYGGPNVAKPLHVGHMRTAIVGESIKRILNFMGHTTISDVHLGDFGLQIGEVIYAIINDNKNIDDIDIAYLDEAYPRMSAICKENEEIKNECATITKDLQDGNIKYRELWKKILEVSSKDIKNNYDYLDVHFDYWYGESDAYNYIKEAENIVKPYLVESDGALVIPVTKETDAKELPPLIFKKSNGAYLYATTDIATILQRCQDFNPDHILYVTDNRQAMHFEQVFRTVDKAGIISKDKLEHLGYGTVNGNDGKPYKTRNGDAPKLMNLFENAKEIFVSQKESNKEMSKQDIDIIVNAILKFADLQNSRDKDYIFDLNKFSEVTGKTGPYILYTYLRFNKIIKNISVENNFTNNIYNEWDRNLRLKLIELPIWINKSYIERKPNYIAEYVYNLCVCANAFYQHNYLNNESDKEKLNNYIIVLKTTTNIIKELLKLLVIEIPSVM